MTDRVVELLSVLTVGDRRAQRGQLLQDVLLDREGKKILSPAREEVMGRDPQDGVGRIADQEMSVARREDSARVEFRPNAGHLKMPHSIVPDESRASSSPANASAVGGPGDGKQQELARDPQAVRK